MILCALGAEVYFLLRDVPIFRPLETVRPTSPPIAELIAHRNTVRVQNPGALIWEEVRNGETLFRKQQVLTLEKSKAEIAFLDGTGIVVDENSLVQLEKTPSDDSLGYRKLVIRLMRGSIHKTEARKTPQLARRISEIAPQLEVVVGNSTTVIPPQAELTITSGPEGARIRVQQGEIQIQTPTGDLSLKQGEEASLADERSQALPTARKSAFNLLAPQAGENIDSARAGALHFVWAADLAAVDGSPVDLEASQDPLFKTGVKSLRIGATEPPLEKIDAELALPAALKPTQWFWRVKKVGETSVQSETRTFWQLPPAIPVPRLPRFGATISEGKNVDFLWNTVDGATGYELEVSSPDARTHFTRELTARSELLPVGPVKWRVRAKLQDSGFGPWSEPASFEVLKVGENKAAELPPPPGELEAPEILEEPQPPAPRHTWLNWLIPEAYARERQWRFRLRWSPVSGITEYRIQISTDKEFKEIISRSKVNTPEFIWTYRPGEKPKEMVYFRVASVTIDGRIGTYSEPKPFAIPQTVLAQATIVQAKKAVAAKEATRKMKTSSLTKSKPETYPAIENVGPSVPADAAPSGDLHTAVAKASPVAPVAASSVPTAAQPSVAKESVAAANANPPVADPGSPAPSNSMIQTTAQVPTTGSNQVIVAGSTLDRWNFSGGIFGGVGNLRQIGQDPTLNSVTLESAYARTSLGLGAALLRKTEGQTPVRYSAALRLSTAGFDASASERPIPQTAVKATNFDLEALRWADFSPWRLAIGIDLSRSFRWIKSGPQTVEPGSAFSFGPVGYAVRNYHDEAAWKPAELGLGVALPLSGVIGSGFYGVAGKIWGEWKLTRAQNWIGLRIEGQGAYQRWSSPTDTFMVAWTAWLAPVIHLGADDSDWPSPSP